MSNFSASSTLLFLRAGWAQFCMYCYIIPRLLQWHHNERDGVPNHRRFDCLFNRLFMCSSKKTSTLCVTGFCEGNPPMIGGFPSQTASNVENVSMWWRHRLPVLPGHRPGMATQTPWLRVPVFAGACHGVILWFDFPYRTKNRMFLLTKLFC